MPSDPTQAAPTVAGPTEHDHEREHDHEHEQVPRPLMVVAAITALESVVALVYALWLVVESVTGTPRERGQAIAVGVTFLILAIPLPLVPRALARASMRGRTPAVMMQLLALWVAYFMVEARFWIGAVPTVAAAVVGLVGIFTPASTAALTRYWRADGDPADGK